MGKPDHFEKCLRFGCGFSAGALIGIVEVANSSNGLFGWRLIAGVGIAIALGLLALHYGDKFWYALLRIVGRY